MKTEMEMTLLKPAWTKDNSYEAQGLGLGDLTPVAILLVVVVVAVAIGAYILNTIGTTFTANSAAANVTTKGTAALATFSNWFTIIAIVVVAAIVIGLLVRSFYGGGQTGGGRV